MIVRGFLFAAVCAALAPGVHATGEKSLLSIGVRSNVNNSLPAVPEAGFRGRLFALLSVEHVKSQARLIKPVDEVRLTRQLVAALVGRGFQLADEQQKPEILLTVQYGRGWLKPPSRSDAADTGADTQGSPPEVSVKGTSVAHVMNLGPGSEAEFQKASYEKLFVRVMAWAYPTDPKARPQRLWQTTMVVDDPDHRDLNLVTSQLFAAGAPYFDRATERSEVSVFLSAADAQVNVGSPVVVGEPTLPAASSPPPAPRAAAAPPPALKRFDVPAGAALTTLQVFSRQSGEEIIYPTEDVRTVQTRAVSGEFSARAALDRMLEQTGLVGEWDEKSGICIVRRAQR